jgi:hypothetical protein
VQQILTLEEDRMPDRLREALRPIQRRRPAGVIAQQALQLTAEGRIRSRGLPCLLEL